MTMNRFFLLFLVAVSFCFSVQGRIFANIDTFATLPTSSLFLEKSGPPTNPPVWYSPYGETAGTGPTAVYQNTPDALSGQRDLVCGYFTNSDDGANVNVNIQPGTSTCSVAISLGFFGSCYVQWDGDDTGGSTAPFPGSNLSSVPGIGSGGNPYANPDGQSMDFTFGGFATAITSTIIADHDVFYYYKVIDKSGAENDLQFFTSGGEQEFTFDAYFSSPDWSNAAFDWTQVVAFQVRIQTAEASGTSSTAVDTDFKFLNIVGYEIAGDVYVDCECDGTPSQFTEGATVTLYNSANTPIATDITDVAGMWSFDGQVDGAYRVCLTSPASLCAGSLQCVDFTLADFVDPPVMHFATTVQTTVTVPPNAQLNCGDCFTTACLGEGVENGCNGQVTLTPNDVDNGDICNRMITRTWTSQDGSISRTQVITVVDNLPPTLVNPAQPSSAECGTTGGDTIDAWIARNADASATDCNGVSWTNNYNGATALCGAIPVIFTASDPCGHQVTTSATFTITDGTPPVVLTQPTGSSASCDAKGTSVQTAYNTWVQNRGGATASDTCDSDLTWAANAPAVANGCDVPHTVVWTISDDCANSVQVSAVFTVTDSQPPVIQTPASDSSVECTSGGAESALQSWLASRGGATATDNCIANDQSLTWTNNWDNTVPNSCAGGVPVTFTVTDPCGMTATTAATFSINDTAPPTITRPASPASAQCSSDGSISTAFNEWVANNGGAQATDACSTFTWSNNAGTAPPSGCSGGLTVVFTVRDDCNGMTASTSAVFSVVDSTPPTVTVPPGNQQADCSSDVNSAFQSWLASSGGAQGTDNCGGVTWSNDFTGTGPVIGCNAVTTVRFTAQDICGLQSAPQAATFTVTDSNLPSVTPAMDQSAECDNTNNNSQLQDWLNAHGGATATEICYSADQLSWSNNFTSLSSGPCDRFAVVQFTVTDPCGQSASTTATFRVTDTVPPVVEQPIALILECGPNNAQEIQEYIANRGGAIASDSCSEVTWTLESQGDPVACQDPTPIIWELADACGNCASAYGSVVINDITPPEFVNFPRDIVVPCDQETDPSVTGHPEARDNCWTDLDLGFTDTQVQEPTYRFCPGDIIITRTWVLLDPCGNMVSRTQTIVHEIARRVGPCIPQPCPPCETVCCTEQTNRIECNPVPCNSVGCNPVACDSVPCVPQNCDGSGAGDCEPVYIYVFNDDDDNTVSAPDYIERSSAGVLGVSFISLLIIALSVLF